MHEELDSIDNEALIERTNELIQQHPGGWGDSFAIGNGTWNTISLSHNILATEPAYEDLAEEIVQHVATYADILGVDQSQNKLGIFDSWMNANDPGNFQECHVHTHSYISGVYYPRAPKDGGKFEMDNPHRYDWNPFEGEQVSSLSEVYGFVPSDGDLILFPSNIEHHVERNESDERRFSLAFNVTIDSLAPMVENVLEIPEK